MRIQALLLLSLVVCAGTPGSIVLEDQFDGPALNTAWRAAKGEWKQDGGALRGVEIASEKHAAVVRRPVAFQDGTVQLRFRLDGARQIALSINGADGHICRVVVTPKGFRIAKDPDLKKGEKAITLAASTTPVATGEWQELTLIMEGSRMSARIGGTLLTGEHPGIAEAKADVGLPVGGTSASFDWIKVYRTR